MARVDDSHAHYVALTGLNFARGFGPRAYALGYIMSPLRGLLQTPSSYLCKIPLFLADCGRRRGMNTRAVLPRRAVFKRQRRDDCADLFDPLDDHDLERDTVLLPELIAERVLDEAERCVGCALPGGWVERLATRAARCYQGNERFRGLLNRPGHEGRDWLAAFMRHWMIRLLKNHDSALVGRLPYGFSLSLIHI